MTSCQGAGQGSDTKGAGRGGGLGRTLFAKGGRAGQFNPGKVTRVWGRVGRQGGGGRGGESAPSRRGKGGKDTFQIGECGDRNLWG